MAASPALFLRDVATRDGKKRQGQDVRSRKNKGGLLTHEEPGPLLAHIKLLK